MVMSSNNNSVNNDIEIIDIESQIKKIRQINENKSEDTNTCCMNCFLLLFGLAIIAGAVSYYVFGIMFLVKDYDVASNCNGSNLWAYVLTSIILALSRSNAKGNIDKEDNNGTLCKILILGLVEVGLAIWGGIELWKLSCNDLSETNLWNFGLATFCIQSFAAFLCLIVTPIVLCIITSRL